MSKARHTFHSPKFNTSNPVLTVPQLVGIGFVLGSAVVAAVTLLPWASWTYQLTLLGVM